MPETEAFDTRQTAERVRFDVGHPIIVQQQGRQVGEAEEGVLAQKSDAVAPQVEVPRVRVDVADRDAG